MSTYLASEVDPIIQDLTSQLEAAVVLAKNATDKLAAAESERKVVLEKVVTLQKSASTRVGLTPALIDETVGQLVDMRILRPERREKLASDLAGNPDAALHLVTKMLTLSVDPAPGVGFPKNASVFKSTQPAEGDPDGWDMVIKHGA